MTREDDNGIDERSFQFFCNVIAFVETIPIGPKTSRIIEQLVDSAGSVGSNREEALGGSSHREFIRYSENSLRSANESVRWLRTCSARSLGSQQKCLPLLDEGRQLARMLGKIVVTAKRRAEEREREERRRTGNGGDPGPAVGPTPRPKS
jgi:four helix bundle protein